MSAEIQDISATSRVAIRPLTVPQPRIVPRKSLSPPLRPKAFLRESLFPNPIVQSFSFLPSRLSAGTSRTQAPSCNNHDSAALRKSSAASPCISVRGIGSPLIVNGLIRDFSHPQNPYQNKNKEHGQAQKYHSSVMMQIAVQEAGVHTCS